MIFTSSPNKLLRNLLGFKELIVTSHDMLPRKGILHLWVKPHKNGACCPECARRCKLVRRSRSKAARDSRTWRDIPADGGRGHGTAIYFLLPGDVENRWHRVDAVEIWHHLAGAPLDLEIGKDSPTAETTVHLGTDLRAGERPQGIVPAHHWQRAKSRGEWTLVSCTVSPAFQFEGFELRPTAESR